MPPSLSRTVQLRWGELRVIDEDVGIRSQLKQTLIQRLVARLVVRGIGHDSRGSLNPESQAALGMVQPSRGYLVFADLEAFSAVHLAEFPARAHGRKIHREIRQRHLRFKHLLQGIPAKELRAETVELELILLHVERRKKGQPLDVVP